MAKRATLLPALCLAALALGAAPAAPPRSAVARPTVEPTLALTIDPAFEDVERGSAWSSGRLRLEIQAVDDVAEVALVLRAPDGLWLDGAATHRLAALVRGEARTITVPFHARRERDLDLRVEATFRTSDGATRTLGQGITLTASEPTPPGRRRLGAYECQAVPLTELHR